MIRKTYRPGAHLVVCDRTGFVVYAEDTVKEWTGLRVRRESAEQRHPQDHVKGRIDRQGVPDARPRPADYFLATNEVTADSL
jgi:hypothetical protein